MYDWDADVNTARQSFIGPDPFTAAYLQFRFPPSSSSRPVVTVVPTVPVKATLPRFGQPQPVVVAPQPTVRAPSISTVSTSSHSTRIAIASEPADELLRIESALRSFKGKGKACHCAGSFDFTLLCLSLRLCASLVLTHYSQLLHSARSRIISLHSHLSQVLLNPMRNQLTFLTLSLLPSFTAPLFHRHRFLHCRSYLPS